MDAEDAAQETLIRVCRYIHNLSDPKAFGAWLDKIIINETRRVAAKNSKRDDVLIFGEYIDTVVEESEEDSVELLPMEFTLREEDRRIVNEIIGTLPDRQREAVLLHYFDGLNVTETASVMETTKGNVSYYLKLACEKVGNELSKRAGGHEAAYSFGLLPIGPLLSQTLLANEEAFTPLSDAWVKKAVSKGAMAMKGKTAAAAYSGFANSWQFVGILVALIASGVVFLGASSGNANAASKAPDELAPAYGQIILNGTGEGSYVNPGLAIAQAGTGDSDMTALDWRITAAGSDTVLYSGVGGVVDSALTDLREHGDDGVYLLTFHMADGAGNKYSLKCNFLIV